MHGLLEHVWPGEGRYGLRDYEEVFQSQDEDDVYDLRGIDRSKGCVVIVRPNQHIASILPLAAHAELSSFFDAFMI